MFLLWDSSYHLRTSPSTYTLFQKTIRSQLLLSSALVKTSNLYKSPVPVLSAPMKL